MTKNHVIRTWRNVQAGYWFIPAVMSLGAVGLSYLMPYLDDVVQGHSGELPGWVYGGGVGGARAVLSSIAGSMITVASLTFSITLVALSGASQQYGPRVLNNFMRDRGFQVVLGTFVATFLYSIMVLRQIQDVNGEISLPRMAVSIAILMVIVALALLIYFFHHAAASLRAETVVGRVADEMMTAIDRLFELDKKEAGDERVGVDVGDSGRPGSDLAEGLVMIVAADSGYVQAIDEGRLTRIAAEEDLVLHMQRRVGEFVLEGADLVAAQPAQRITPEATESIREAVDLGPHGYLPGELEAAANELVEIALRALSPSLNDPNTAIACIDQLARGLGRLAEQQEQRRRQASIRGWSSPIGHRAPAFRRSRRPGLRSESVITRGQCRQSVFGGP